MMSNELANHPLKPFLISSYRHFRSGNILRAIEILKPVLSSEAARQPGLMTGIIWGLTGDCYFKLKDSENGFAAYRQAIELDPKAGCLVFFARQVAAYRRTEDAAFASECLDAYRVVNREALIRYPVHHIIHSLPPDMLYLRFLVVPCVRWRLRRMMKKTKS